MWCLISQPNSVVFEVKCDPKAIGQECLEKVCEYLGISNEADYFGLKYENSKGEELWLNLRNPIDRQVTYHGHTSPLRLALRVKFWVPPHLLLLESTRHQFYLHGRLDLMQKRLIPKDWSGLAKLIALLAQAESGDFDPYHPPYKVYSQFSNITPETTKEQPSTFFQKIIDHHKNLKTMKAATAEYWVLKHMSLLGSFGEETYQGKSPSYNIGVGPNGITLYKSQEKELIPFTAIQTASSNKRTFRLEYVAINNINGSLEIKLESSHAASSLYRSITEKHAFYSCETVRSAVTAQFIRDLKGTIVSIFFNEDSTLGKKYVFDIRRTCREVYDNARRAIYQEKTQNVIEPEKVWFENEHYGDNKQDSEERLTRLLDAMSCKICMDSQIDTAFLPCAHLVACEKCAARCERCPVCRADIGQVQKIFLPGEFSQPVC